MKPFILMTTGRAGSTALMDKLSSFEDISVPNKQIDCRDNEILHPRFIRNYAALYQRKTGMQINDEISLMNAFFSSSRNSAYAGFKSMPNRHRNLAVLFNTKIQFITLNRSDIASTVASFIIATDAGTWRREGGKQTQKFTFVTDYEQRAIGHLRFIVNSMKALKSIPNAIHLQYENLCQETFDDDRLNSFFARKIQLDKPKEPTLASHYVENWPEFKRFIDINLNSLNE